MYSPHYPNFVPQPPQNFVPGGFSCPQPGHFPVAGGSVGAPQLLQKRTPCASLAPHLPQAFISILAPQLLQNLPVPAGLPQVGHTIVLLSILPCQTVDVAPASSILRLIASARAFATKTSCLGAQSTHSPSSSFRQASHTYLWQE